VHEKSKTEAPRSRLLTVEEFAEYLRVKPSWVYERTRMRSTENPLPVVPRGRYLLFDPDSPEMREWEEREKVLRQQRQEKRAEKKRKQHAPRRKPVSKQEVMSESKRKGEDVA
jgi:hypothetical protein